MKTIDPKIKKEDESMKIVDDIFNKFKNARSTKQAKIDIWDKCLEAYNSEYFKNASKPEYKSDEISNFIFSTIETIKPIMVDNDPKIMVMPKTPEGIDIVDKLQSAFDYEWTRAKMSKKLIQAVTVSLQIGTAVFGMFWDGKDENGLGNVNPQLINPYNLFPDPMATCVEDAEYILYATYKQVNSLKQKYPQHADKLTSGTVNYAELVSKGQDTTNVTNQVLVIESYMRDYTTVDYEDDIADETTGKTTTVTKQKRKYPNGKIVIVAPELNLLLEEKPMPYVDGKFPFFLLKCYDIPFEFWGSSEIEQLLSPQTYINELTNQIIDNAKLTANMPWIIDRNSGIGKGQLTNRPGLIVRKNPGTSVERKQPPQMPVYVQEMVNTFKQDIEIISGVHDVTQGRKPGSISAASAIMALQEAAQARIRLKVKLMELSLSEIGLSWYRRMQQFWVTTRTVRTTTNEGMFMFQDINPNDLRVEIDFTIVGGSTMPTNKNAMLDLMIRLAQTPAEDGLPMVDRDTVLTYTNIPDKKKIVQKFADITGRNKEQQTADQEQAMAQQQAMAEHQAALEQQSAQQKAQNDQDLAMVNAGAQQVAKTNTQVTDEQLQMVLEMLMANPEMLAQMGISLPQSTQEGIPTPDMIANQVG